MKALSNSKGMIWPKDVIPKLEAFQSSHPSEYFTVLIATCGRAMDFSGRASMGEAESSNSPSLLHYVRSLLGPMADGQEIEVDAQSGSILLAFGHPASAVGYSLCLQAGLRTFSQENGEPVFDRFAIHARKVSLAERKGLIHISAGYAKQLDLCVRLAAMAMRNQTLVTAAA